MTSNLKSRLILGISLSTFVTATILYSQTSLGYPLFLLLLFGSTLTTLSEFYQLCQKKGHTPLSRVGLLFGALYLAAIYKGSEELALLSLALTVTTSATYFFFKGKEPLINSALTLFALFYIVVPLSFLLRIHNIETVAPGESGALWLLYLILVTKMTDVGAYFSGKKFGKHPLAPKISPNKTIEGLFGGICTALITSLTFAHLTNRTFTEVPFTLSFLHANLFGVSIALIGVLGDLVESLFKRDAGIKDSSTIPGLGGFLDMEDSLIFTAPLLYLIIRLTF